eukprot:364398-Chlamydomonas_euryale.AAC.7
MQINVGAAIVDALEGGKIAQGLGHHKMWPSVYKSAHASGGSRIGTRIGTRSGSGGIHLARAFPECQKQKH